MEEYIVSARKYRPLTFDSVVGQQSLTGTLRNAVRTGKLAHAYLFCGPRGVGKTTCARIFAKAINCASPTADGEACGQCESCRAFAEGRSFNVFELDAASNNSVEHIKQLMDQTRIPPQVGTYKVFIIDEVHMLSTQAFNAFLKTLEEPPAHVIFILATTEKHKILPTIISRCQIFDFERMTLAGIINHLKMVAQKEGVTYEEEALAVIAEKADGGMRDALSTFDQAVSFCQGNVTYAKVIEDLNVLDAENYFSMVDMCLQNKVSELMVLLNSLLAKGFDGGRLVSGLARHIRNVMMANDATTLPLLEVSERQQEKYRQQAQRCPQKFIFQALRLLNDCDLAYRQSSAKRLLVELTLIEVAQLTQEDKDVPSSGRRPRRLKTLFRKLAGATRHPKAAPQVAAAAPDARPDDSQKTKPGTSTSSPNPPVISLQATAKPTQRFKLRDLGTSFSSLLRSAQEKAPVEEKVEKTGSTSTFTEADLRREWLAMCLRMGSLPDFAAMAARMKNLQPSITEYPAVEVVIGNSQLLSQVQSIATRIRNTLIKQLGNDDITLSLRLARQEEIKPILTQRQRLDKAIETDDALRMLCKELELRLH